MDSPEILYEFHYIITIGVAVLLASLDGVGVVVVGIVVVVAVAAAAAE